MRNHTYLYKMQSPSIADKTSFLASTWLMTGEKLICLIFCFRLHKKAKAASEVDYPAYGVTGPAKERIGPGPGDRKLAQSAQMYHYQHQKQQMIAMEKYVLNSADFSVKKYFRLLHFR